MYLPDQEYGYVAFYNKRKVEVYAKSLFDAKEKAVRKFKVPAKQQHLVVVVLAESLGLPVTQSSLF